MKKTFLLLVILLGVRIAYAQYKPVDQGSELKFIIGNFGFNVTGMFSGFQGTINFDPQSLAAINFDVSIDASTVNTDNALRDDHLKGESYFDTKNHPRIRLVSVKVMPANKSGMYTLTGQLMIKGKSKEITFPFTAVPSNDGYIFKGSFKINRKDFGIGGTSTISNELEVNLNVHAVKS